jgi:hypothetical protein
MPENTNKEEKTGFGSKNLRAEPNKIFTINHIREDKTDFASKNLHTEHKKILPRILHNTKERGRSCLQNINSPLYKTEHNKYPDEAFSFFFSVKQTSGSKIYAWEVEKRRFWS